MQIAAKVGALVALIAICSRCGVLALNRRTFQAKPISATRLKERRSEAVRNDYLTLDYYAAAANAEQAKNSLQGLLHNFLENLQKNLTISNVLKYGGKIDNRNLTQRKINKLHDLGDFFEIASHRAQQFAHEANHFLEAAKNQSNDLLLKLRKVPSPQRFLPNQVKLLLTEYFTEMEYLHIMFSETIDVALEYTIDTLQAIQGVFINSADIQRDVLRYWNKQPDEWCCNRYMDFIQSWSADVFRCAVDPHLNTVYDVFSITQATVKYVLRQLEFRVQRLYNCFLLDNYYIRCGPLRNAERDFEKLFLKLEDAQMYYDIKTKRGLLRNYLKSRRRRRQQDEAAAHPSIQQQCLSQGFLSPKC